MNIKQQLELPDIVITIKNATFVNGEKHNIITQNNKIVDITDTSTEIGNVIHLPENIYVSAGWIDIHTHAFPHFEPNCSHPDDIGYKTAVTTAVDAGSCGADDIDTFHDLAQKSRTRVLSFLNISRDGRNAKKE